MPALSLLACHESGRPDAGARVGRMDCAVGPLAIAASADPHQLHNFAISPLFEIPLELGGAEARWSRGAGLLVEPGAEPAQVSMTSPITLNEGERSRVALRASGGGAGVFALEWTDAGCPDFAPACRIEADYDPQSEDPIWFDLSGRLHEQALRLRLTIPARSTPVTLRELSVQPRADAGSNAIEHAVAGGEEVTAIRWANAVQMERVGRTTRLAISDVASDPFLSFEVGRPAAELGFLVLRFDGLPEQSVDLYFAGTTCPKFSELCRVRIEHSSGDGRWLLATHAIRNWLGRIDEIRIDFNGPASEANLSEVRFVPRDAFEALLGPSAVHGALRRLEGGGSGFAVRTGEGVECSFGADPGRRLPTSVHVRVAPGQGLVQFLRLRATWLLSDGASVPAATRFDTVGGATAEGDREIALVPPPERRPDEVSGIRFEVVCARNCAAMSDDAFEIELERPRYQWSAPEPERPKSLLLISLDTVRADSLSIYGSAADTTPRLAAWASKASVYDAAYAVDTWTLPTHAALFTGRYPVEGAGGAGYPGISGNEATLAELLAAKGYGTEASTDGVFMVSQYGVDRGFDIFRARYEPLEHKLDEARDAIERQAENGAPFFFFLHTYAVHEPYSLPLDGVRLDAFLDRVRGLLPARADDLIELGKRLAGPLRERAPATVPYLRSLYDTTLGVVDTALVDFLEDLERDGLLDDVVVVVTSDHGEEFFEYQALGHGTQLPRPELTHVPFLLHRPGQREGKRIQQPIAQPALTNLMLDALAVDARAPTDPCLVPGLAGAFVGTAAHREFPIDQYVSIAVNGAACMTLEVTRRSDGVPVFGETKLFSNQDACDAARPAMREVAACLRSRILAATTTETKAPAPPDATPIDPRVRDQLRALGYTRDE